MLTLSDFAARVVRLLVPVGIALVGGALVAAPRAAQADDVLADLKPGHPRIYLDAAEFDALKLRIEQDPVLKHWYDLLQQEAEATLDAAPVEHKLVTIRLLNQSRKALRRISILAGLYRLDGDRRKFERARREMLVAADFPDWNPKHFLDTAEMTHALAIGYDWLYDELSPEDRQTIRQAIIEKGFRPGLEYYEAQSRWVRRDNNWPQVCNGGLTIGALAIADEAPDVCRRIIDYGRDSMAHPMASYAPDGGWHEGPAYWSYGTGYAVCYLAALESALGRDFGFKKTPGFSATGDFRMHTIAPSGRTFNFADARDRPGTSPEMLWLARTFDRPEYAAFERRLAAEDPEMLHLVWSADRPADRPPALARDALYRHVNVAIFRSDWDDPHAVYLGFKNGSNAVSHSHLDLGSFVVEALGQRWAVDLGSDDYDLPSYFGGKRWTYFRLRTQSHNTLLVDGQDQSPTALAPIVAYDSKPDRAFAVADLTEAYAPAVSSLRRGAALINRRDVLIQDEAATPEPADIHWQMFTPAAIETSGNRAALRLGGQTIHAVILQPAGAVFEVGSADAPPPEAQQPDIRRLMVRLRTPGGDEPSRLAIALSPREGAAEQLEIEPLDAWVEAGPLSGR